MLLYASDNDIDGTTIEQTSFPGLSLNSLSGIYYKYGLDLSFSLTVLYHMNWFQI